jgi:hypothetical protein
VHGAGRLHRQLVDFCDLPRGGMGCLIPMALNRNRIWTADEDKRLLEMQHSGRAFMSIAAALKRSQAAIEGRLYVLRKRETKSSPNPDPKP